MADLVRSPSAGSASGSYLRGHEQSDLMRQVESLQVDMAQRDAEIARLRALTDKGALQARRCTALLCTLPFIHPPLAPFTLSEHSIA
jgi:hypothetical protein